MSIARWVLVGIVAVGCYSPKVPDGKLKCSTSGNKCPEGFFCAPDGTCWKNGHQPTTTMDMSQPPDMAKNVGGALPPHAGSSVVSGAVTAKSENYKIIMTTGAPPGGNTNAASTTFNKRGGPVGATQGK
jgi:hypothetical protein